MIASYSSSTPPNEARRTAIYKVAQFISALRAKPLGTMPPVLRCRVMKLFRDPLVLLLVAAAATTAFFVVISM
jgi:hypothetical protein